MFGRGVRLFTVAGFQVRIDASWLLLAVLITLSLTRGYFPSRLDHLSPAAYWVMGLAGALGLFASIILHELCHSLVARHFGLPMTGITLFMFGGMAQMGGEARSPRAEACMAVAGPLASVALAGLFYGLQEAAKAAGGPAPVTGVLGYLAWINLVLALFNLLPAFPLDGGRILRAGLWAWKKNLQQATRIASGIGTGFGDVLIILGILALLGGNLVGGLWWCLTGLFLRGVSQGSYRQLVIRDALAGEPVRRIMRPDPVTVPSTLTVAALIHDFIYRHHFKMYPVVDAGRLVGCVSTREVKELPRDNWESRTVGDIAEDCSAVNTIGPDADAMAALTTMNRNGSSRLMVVENGRLVGLLAARDLMQFLALKLELEGPEGPGRLP